MLREGYRRSGGLATASELVNLLRRHADQPVSLLARWIVSRQVVSVVWESQTLLPLAQFELDPIAVKPRWQQLIEELNPAFDDFDLASWFARPNSWLAWARPVDTIGSDMAAVAQAARADRFIVLG